MGRKAAILAQCQTIIGKEGGQPSLILVYRITINAKHDFRKVGIHESQLKIH